jgi:hypothetical protein
MYLWTAHIFEKPFAALIHQFISITDLPFVTLYPSFGPKGYTAFCYLPNPILVAVQFLSLLGIVLEGGKDIWM